MLPLLPFLAGIAVGAWGVSAARSGRGRQVLHQVGEHVREAAHTGSQQLREATQAGQSWGRSAWERWAPGAAQDSDEATPPAAAPVAQPPVAASRTAPARPARKRSPKKAST